MARPKKVIDYEQVEKLANMMCTQEEIAEYVGISTRTLQKDEEFLHVYKKGQEIGKMSLRRSQFKKAIDGNVTMMIWLGKQYLKQTESPDEVEVNIAYTKARIQSELNSQDETDSGSDVTINIGVIPSDD